MKKMTFALACASTAVLFAGVPNAIGFEAYTLPDGVDGSFTGLSGKSDDATSSVATDSFWLYMGAAGAVDGSAVKKFAVGEALDPLGEDTSNSQYLELSTEGGTLWRSINHLVDSETLGAAQAVPVDTGIYLDTMVQFTPTEDSGMPDTDPADKIALWLNVDSTGATNLMVKASRLYTEGTDEAQHALSTNAVYVVSNPEVEIQAGEWHRLTLKAVKNVLNVPSSVGSQEYVSAFEISIDGKVMAVTGEKVATDDFIAFYSENEGAGLPDCFATGAAAALQAGTLIPSLKGYTEYVDQSALTAVGFKGSGKIDNLQFSYTDPNPPGPAPVDTIDFTITAADGVTIKWSTDGESWTTYDATTAKAAAGKIYVQLTTADGGVKVVEKTVSGDDGASNEFDLSEEAFGWAEYLGEAVDGAYVIDDEAELDKFAAKHATLKSVDSEGNKITFALGANIALTKPWAGIGTYNVTPGVPDAFKGTFDGKGFKISNVVMADNGSDKNNYRGFFTQAEGATIKNLTVESSGFGATPPSGEYGSAAIVGYAYNTTIEDCTSEGTVTSATHNAGGIVIRARGATIKNCTNKANITGNYSKIAGICVLSQNEAAGEATLIEGCVNEGTITAGAKTTSKDPGCDGCAGIIAYVGTGNVLTIKDCENRGTLTKAAGVTTTPLYGQIIAYNYNGVKALQGTIKGTTATRMIGNNNKVTTRHLATVAGDVATFIEDSTVAAGGSYMAMATGGTVTLANVDDSITLDTTLATATVTTTATDAYVAQAGNVYTVTAKSDAEFTVSIDPTEAEWTDTLTLPTPTITGTTATGSWSPAAITEPDAGTTNTYTYTVTVAATDTTKETTKSVEFKVYKNATVVYPDYITDDTAKGKFDTWASEVAKIDGDDRKTASMDAYLLNVAPANVDTAKAAFKIVSIEQDAEGAWTIKVTADKKTDGQAYGNGTIEVQGATTLQGPWAKDTAGAKFFKAILK